VVPVIVATLAFAWWYRSSNTHATRSLDESYEGRVEFVVWSIPALTDRLLATHAQNSLTSSGDFYFNTKFSG
jgi:heme/copper-type cytochrome/quinol oxidase subunit 2